MKSTSVTYDKNQSGPQDSHCSVYQLWQRWSSPASSSVRFLPQLASNQLSLSHIASPPKNPELWLHV